MSTSTLKRALMGLMALVMLVTMLFSATPAFAKDDGTAEYTVKKGETLTEIAKRFEITVEQIMAVNPDLKNPNNLHAGQVIILPAGRGEGVTKDKEGRIYVWQRERNGGRIEKEDRLYLVRSGDTLTGIAKRYGITLKKLLEANPQIEDENKLYRGELVKIPTGLAEYVPPFYETPRPPHNG